MLTISFALGFVSATCAWWIGMRPSAFSFLGFEYPFTPVESSILIDLCDNYNFEFYQPLGGYTFVNGEARLSGTVSELPPFGSVRLITILEGDPVTYWPQPAITIEPTTKKWSGIIYSSYDVTATVVVLGDNGKILFDYFDKVVYTASSQKGEYSGLTQLTNDIWMCEQIIVRQP